MTETNNPSGASADVLAVLGLADARTGSRALGHDGPDRDEWEEYAEVSMEKLAEFAALVARNAELKAERDRYKAELRSVHDGILKLFAERDALAAEVKALREGFSQEAITKYVSEYEYRGEEADMYGVNGVYSPQAFDRLLIEDAMRGWADHVNSIDAARASAATGGGNG